MKIKNNIHKESLYFKAWHKSNLLTGSAANMAANVERRTLLNCWQAYTIAKERDYDLPTWVRATLLSSVSGLLSPDLKALIAHIPTAALIAAIRVDGTFNTPSVGRYMVQYLIDNQTTAVAIAQTAQKTMADARREAKKAAKKAALAAKKAAKKAATEYAINNTCGQI